jgi:membrane-bound lytic murein transglycosylase D
MTSRPLTTNSNKVVSNPVESEIDAILAQIPKVTQTAPKIETSTVASSARSNPSAPKSTAVQTKTTQTPTKPIQAPPTNPVYHTIRTGETVGSIAQTYGIKVEDLRQANKTTIGRRDRINVGQKLVIPGSIQIAGTSASVKKNAPAQHIVVHKVKRGESLDKIAIKYNTTIASIKSLNRLRTSTIHPGNELKIIPGMTKANNQVSSAKPIRYTVRSGDTLSDISKEFGISTSTIMQTNSLQSSRLVAGQVLQIPVF